MKPTNSITFKEIEKLLNNLLLKQSKVLYKLNVSILVMLLSVEILSVNVIILLKAFLSGFALF